MAPEFVKDGRVGCECDIYSLGILIMVIVMGKGPDGTELCGTAYINEVSLSMVLTVSLYIIALYCLTMNI